MDKKMFFVLGTSKKSQNNDERRSQNFGMFTREASSTFLLITFSYKARKGMPAMQGL
jgi:hypothetical protein